jgi:hypothetical protein
MNIYQLSVKSGIPVTKLRKLEKLKALVIDQETEFLDKLIFHMRGNQTLSVSQLLTLIREPALLEELAAARPRYAKRAGEQIAALGDISQHEAPVSVIGAIVGASRGDDDESLVIVNWLQSILPAEPVPHAWIAVRLLKPVNEFTRGQLAPLISPAMLNVRKLPEFKGYWHSWKAGSRSVISYYRKSVVDALDL